jgi:hypothetical protein
MGKMLAGMLGELLQKSPLPQCGVWHRLRLRLQLRLQQQLGGLHRVRLRLQLLLQQPLGVPNLLLQSPLRKLGLLHHLLTTVGLLLNNLLSLQLPPLELDLLNLKARHLLL